MAQLNNPPDHIILRALYYVKCITHEYHGWKALGMDTQFARRRVWDLEVYGRPPTGARDIAQHLQKLLTVGIILADWRLGNTTTWRGVKDLGTQ